MPKSMLRTTGGVSLLRGSLGVQVVVGNRTIDDHLTAHGQGAPKRAHHGQGKVRWPYKKTASKGHVAPGDLRAAVPMPQESDFRIEHKQRPLLPVARVHVRVQGARSPGVRTKVGMANSEIQMKLYENGIRLV